MKLYQWRSAALKEYYPGYIIVMAETADKARALAVTKGTAYLLAADPVTLISTGLPQLLEDLSTKPLEFTPDQAVILIRGSE